METGLSKATDLIAPPTFETKVGLLRYHARTLMIASLVFADLSGLLIAYGGTILVWSKINPTLEPMLYLQLLPLLLVFLASYLLSGLYTLGVNAVEELRRLSLSTTVVVLGLGALTFWFRTAEMYSRASFFLAWLFALMLLPALRALVRAVLSRRGLWGEPVAVFGYGPKGRQLVNFLLKNPKMGFRPVVAVHDGIPSPSEHSQCPIIRPADFERCYLSHQMYKIRSAILVTTEIEADYLTSLIESQSRGFSRLIMVSEMSQGSSINVYPYDLGGYLGLEVKQNLLSNFQQMIKRVLDVGLILAGSIILLPIIGILSLLIRLDSPGKVFYAHKRIGQNGKPINVWKFRTMWPNADRVLETYLVKNPCMREEWEATQKIKNDPRITRIGKWLRKMSLDEFPQVWNVLKGEMSLVGPRPIVDTEIHYYGDRFNLYSRVKPGITGLWQVSGRNDVGYRQRVGMDEYYVRNWSVWLDIYILAKTFFVVLRGDGAY